MDLLEYQGKELFRAAGLPVPRGRRADSVVEASATAAEIGLPVAIKAQARAGKRGRAGGIRVCREPAEVAAAAADLLAMTIGGREVECVLVEEAVAIERELYLAFILSRHHRAPLLLMAPRGGMDVEELASSGGELLQIPIDPLLGLCAYQVRDVVMAADLADAAAGGAGTPAVGTDRPPGTQLGDVVRGVWRAYQENDALLVEVNPLVVTTDGSIVCLDAKVTLDENAAHRQASVRDGLAAGERREVEARQAGLSFVGLDGDVGVIGNGAGLVMSTLDLIAAADGRAANFCDVGGGARAEVVAKALDLVLAGESVSSLLVNVFGGITRGDEVARGLIEALRRTDVKVPVFVRLAGNAAADGRQVLAAAGLPGVTVLETAEAAVAAAVAAARQSRVGTARAASGHGVPTSRHESGGR